MGYRTGTAVRTLTPRELSVAALVAEGMSNHQVAGRLFLADKTTSNVVSAILLKLGAANRTQIAAWYLRPGNGQSPARYDRGDMLAAYTAGWRGGARRTQTPRPQEAGAPEAVPPEQPAVVEAHGQRWEIP
jgi:DNA-binding CsgD family transcriptional regulator